MITATVVTMNLDLVRIVSAPPEVIVVSFVRGLLAWRTEARNVLPLAINVKAGMDRVTTQGAVRRHINGAEVATEQSDNR